VKVEGALGIMISEKLIHSEVEGQFKLPNVFDLVQAARFKQLNHIRKHVHRMLFHHSSFFETETLDHLFDQSLNSFLLLGSFSGSNGDSSVNGVASILEIGMAHLLEIVKP